MENNILLPNTEESATAKSTSLAVLVALALCSSPVVYSQTINTSPTQNIFQGVSQYDYEGYLNDNPNYAVLTSKNIIHLEKLYTFKDNKQVNLFLGAHQNLMDTLYDAFKQIQGIFSVHIKNISLEVVKDSEEDFEGLALIINTNLAPELSLDLQDKFDEEWWLNVHDDIRSLMTVTAIPV